MNNLDTSEEVLKNSLARNKALLNAIPDMIFVFDPNSVIVDYYADNQERLYVSPRNFLGKSVEDVLPIEVAVIARKKIESVLSTGKPDYFTYELEMMGSTFYFESRFVICDNNQVLTIVRDISDLKFAEQQLVKAKEKAEESDRLKTAFLANLSHEIRTPLNGIMGFAELLKDPTLPVEELEKYISIIERGGKRMLNTINDLVNISKIESGLMEICISESNINGQIENILALFKHETEQKGIKIFSNNSLPDCDASIKTDWEKVTTVLINLVKNSLKFTSTGYIEIGYRPKGKDMEFYVKDTGVGIIDEQKELIFERFRQGSESITRKYEGAGLGLSISKAYVEILGGKIWVDSKEGKGSKFYFTIPYNDYEIVVNDKKIMDMKILIVEDEEASDILITLAVKDMAREILHVKTGIEAIEACRNNADIDLVLMDIKLFKMNGYEATRKIRQFNKDVVIIAQTAYGLTGDREKALEAGCDDYISKPLNISQLRGLIQKHFNK